ncbi:MAG: hypothetical protein HY784_00900 [Chloroflexi bacterium]|nr:hypothetical protein [Chloroflexota bacterium]
MRQRPGCLAGIFKLLLLDWVFDGLQRRFGFGRGLSCGGCGCGLILLLVFLALTCSVLTGTDWTRLSFQALGLPF